MATTLKIMLFTSIHHMTYTNTVHIGRNKMLKLKLNIISASHHLLLCATASKAKCCDPALGSQTWDELKRVIRELDLENTFVRRICFGAKWIASGCARGGPFVVWPDGIWYRHFTGQSQRIIEHIIGQQPVEEWIFKRTPFSTTNAAIAGKI